MSSPAHTGAGWCELELVAIGDELLLGDTVDSNAPWLAQELAQTGLRVVRRTIVGDDAAHIADAMAGALRRSRAVVCSGGLGPTEDDRTRAALAALFQRELQVDSAVLEQIQARFERRGLVMPERNRVQAEVPVGAIVFPNRHGTAPALALEDERGVVIVLPGVPHEFRMLASEHAIPHLLDRLRPAQPIRHAWLRTTGIAESAVAERIGAELPGLAPLRVAFLPRFSGVDLRVTSWGELDPAGARAALEQASARLGSLLAGHVYSTGPELTEIVSSRLRKRGIALALAESCTGGLASARLTDLAGASELFRGAVVAYADDTKERLLNVSADLIGRYGAVSQEVAEAMVVGAADVFDSDAALAITGIAGPGGGSPEKPVGTVWVAALLGAVVASRHRLFPGSRHEVRERSVYAALALLNELLDGTLPR
ncbi:MAG: CinA family nicotinamide mononucleotide deamidase-related protein [Longimicrobiales bacterium]